MTDVNAILTEALEHRRREVAMHQLNINNYRLALEEVDARHAGQPGMDAFKEQLQGLLDSSLVEQRKEIIMRDVIARQLGVEP